MPWVTILAWGWCWCVGWAAVRYV